MKITLILLLVAIIATTLYINGGGDVATGYQRIQEDGSVLLNDGRVIDAETGELRDKLTP